MTSLRDIDGCATAMGSARKFGRLETAEIDTRREEAGSIDTQAVIARGTIGTAHPAAVALALLRDQTISTDQIKDAARRRLAERTPSLHTFVPLYTTNHCDSECKMCG